jgi:pimeloyl-ACP methyl ester carboxylesterase
MNSPGLAPIAPADWQAGGRDFAWGGHRLFARTAGDGPALLLIHGFPTSSWDWARLWPRLQGRHRLLALDMLGFGRSDKPRDAAYSIAASADQWQDFAVGQGVTEAHVLAHDYGDSVAQELLARQAEGALPFRIASVAFLNGGLFPEAHRALLRQKLLAGPFGPLVARLSGYDAFASAMHRICGRRLDDAELAEHWRLLRLRDGHRVLPALLGYLDERREKRARWVGALQSAKVPLRFVVGTADPISGEHMARAYRAQVPNPDIVELDGVGHYPQVEDAGAVLQAVESFLGAGGAPRGRRDPESMAFFDGVDRRAAP